MNAVLHYQLKLRSDGETGTGVGGELINDVVVRDHHGAPVIRAPHIKGLLLDQLGRMVYAFDWGKALLDWCFGQEGGDTRSGMVRFSDAGVKAGASHDGHDNVRTITRTSVNALGTAAGTTLRTTEAVATGTVFAGTVRFDPGAPDYVELAIRLALLSLEAVGGGRTRGAGCCFVEIDGETRTPGELLKALHALHPEDIAAPEMIRPMALKVKPSDGKPVILRLQFLAEQPVCCPETPVSENNVIRSGIAIPASAVLGTIVARLAHSSADLAKRAMATTGTRAWPLLPCALAGSPPEGSPVHVSLSHKMSKLPRAESNVFCDGAIEPYDWHTASPHSPLKGTDGLLLRKENGVVALWKSGDMPRVVSGHTVLNNERTLYSMESMAPMFYEGYISLPSDAADALMSSLQEDGHTAFGKSRTVRGNGLLTAAKAGCLPEWNAQVFVLQSPAAIPDDWDTGSESAETLLARLVSESGWGTVQEADAGAHMVSVGILAQGGVRFGWNTHGIGKGVEQTRRLQARRVFLPGSVFRLATPLKNLPEMLVRGLGVSCDGDIDGRMQGFGAVLPHPGTAEVRFEPPVLKRPAVMSDQASKLALEWLDSAGRESPSTSQISAIAERLARHGKAKVLEYLERQKMRPDRIWKRWDRVFDSVKGAISGRSEAEVLKALKIWRDISVSKKNNEEE